MALENFIEMRDKTASPVFRTRKKIDNALHRWFPRAFMPLYNMVSFTNIPYAEARRRGRRQYTWLLIFVLAVVGIIALVIGLILPHVIGA
jgi:kynurenine 3-monooxygenase